jgi:ADP-heptose:LPS heptosyltransferase
MTKGVALRRNVLLFHQGALGDFIVTWPLALGLGRVLAQSRIFYITSGQKGALAERALRVESVDVESGWHHLFSKEPTLPDGAMRLLNGAQWIIGFGTKSDDLWSQNVRTLVPEANLVALSTTPPDDFPGHITEYLLPQLAPWPVMSAAMDQMLKSLSTRGLGSAASNSTGPVVLHPGAGANKKCWPPDQYLELAGAIKQSGRPVQVILGEVELEKCPKKQIDAFATAADILKPSTLVDLMAYLSKASAFVGNDSGPGHLAALLPIPTISIFGPANPARWRPTGPNVQIVQGAWDSITPAQVFQLLPK